jgi:hypothetical protein
MAAVTPQTLADAFEADIRALPSAGVAALRTLRRRYSSQCRAESADFVLAAADALIVRHKRRWLGYELIRNHGGAFAACGPRLDSMADGLSDWGATDAFGRTLAGPAWRRGLVGDAQVMAWAASPDRWRRRLALVATVALNAKVDGGGGDAPRTLAVCRALAADRDDLVVKALSWALRELVPRDRAAVECFLAGTEVAARVRREVGHKLATGLKSPRRTA